MKAHRNLQLFSITALADLTGFDRRTVVHRLESAEGKKEGRFYKYTVRQLIDSLLEQAKGRVDEISLEDERAQLARAQREKLEREAQLAEGKLLEADDVLHVWAGIITQMRQKILNSEANEELKAELIEELRSVDLEEYKK